MSSDPLAQKQHESITDDIAAGLVKVEPPYGGHWQTTTCPNFSAQEKYWLLRPGALTTGLRQQGQLDLKVVREYQHELSSAEAWMLKRQPTPQAPIWIREIIMSINGINSVFARSFTPLEASHKVWRGMRGLHTRPLADMLYHDPEITRSPFFVSRLGQEQPLYKSVQHFLGALCPDPHSLVARCSIFWNAEQPLVVAECFLPEFWVLAKSRT